MPREPLTWCQGTPDLWASGTFNPRAHLQPFCRVGEVGPWVPSWSGDLTPTPVQVQVPKSSGSTAHSSAALGAPTSLLPGARPQCLPCRAGKAGAGVLPIGKGEALQHPVACPPPQTFCPVGAGSARPFCLSWVAMAALGRGALWPLELSRNSCFCGFHPQEPAGRAARPE